MVGLLAEHGMYATFPFHANFSEHWIVHKFHTQNSDSRLQGVALNAD